MKFLHRLRAGLLTGMFALLLAAAVSPIKAEATTAQQKEIERQEYYEKEIQSNRIPGWPQGPKIYAEAAIVMEAQTGTVLYAKDIDKAEYPASITKIMTALLACENGNMSDVITYSYWATHSIEAGSSSIGTTEGEELTVEQSLYALMLASANECANGLAEYVAGDIDTFVDMMNARAQELGCTNTHFANANGLHMDDHYVSPHDMALIVQAAMKNEAFRTIAGTAKYTIPATNKDDEPTYMINHHYMIGPYKGVTRYLDDTVIAGKTGYTSNAQNTLVTVAERNGMTLIVVTMRTHSTTELGVPITTDTQALLNYCEENFSKVNVAENETHFTVAGNSGFSVSSGIFGSKASLVEINSSDYIILPNTAVFSQALAELAFEDETGETGLVASLNYTYGGQHVGGARLELVQDAVNDEFSFDEEQEAEGEKTGQSGIYKKGEKTFIKINLRIVIPIILAVIGLILVLIIGRKIYKRWKRRYGGRRPQRRRRRRSIFRRRRRRRRRGHTPIPDPGMKRDVPSEAERAPRREMRDDVRREPRRDSHRDGRRDDIRRDSRREDVRRDSRREDVPMDARREGARRNTHRDVDSRSRRR